MNQIVVFFQVMTGRQNGVGVRLKRELNPLILQIHCIAHRLALVTSQAGSAIPYLKEFQEFLTSVFYWFKHSAVRVHALKHLQEVLDSPQIRIKEVHSVRWFSFNNALDALFRSWDALAMLFEQKVAETVDPKSKGFLKTMSSAKFVIVMACLMDIIPIVTHMNIVFQKQNLDLAIVGPAVKGVIDQLQKLKDPDQIGKFEHDVLEILNNNDTKSYRGVPITNNDKLRQEAQSVKMKFIDKIIEELEKRFPSESQDIVSAFSVLSLRGLRFLSREEQRKFGDDKLDILLDCYKTMINKNEAIQEWSTLKQLVVTDYGLAYDNMSTLWKIIHTHHKGTFPNLSILAGIALALPVSTADVERGFSAQNLVKTSLRNRISSSKLNQLVTIKLNGPPYEEFDFRAALRHFRDLKNRVLP